MIPVLTPVPSPIHTHLSAFQQQPRIKAGSLIMSVFGDAVLPRGGRIWLGSLIGLLAPLAINERLIRTAVFRLVKEGWMDSQTLGRRADYLLTPAGLRRFEESARHIYASNAPWWDRRWRLILTVGQVTPKQRECLRRAFFWQGFGVIGADCFVHPSADLTTAFDALRTDGMSHLLPHLMPLLAAEAGSDLFASNAQMVQHAWDLAHLAHSYEGFVKTYQAIVNQLRKSGPDIDPQTAFLLRTVLIHDYRRLLLRDPELPEVLLPANWPGQKARLLCKEIYRRILPASEQHIDTQMTLADGSTPSALPMLGSRFQDKDPLNPQG